jgi:hypothetical protein
LKDRLHKRDIIVFEIRKFRGQNGKAFAILTVPNITGGNTFLQYHGSRGRTVALDPLVFRGQVLVFQRSNRPGQPEPLKVRTLQEKEAAMRSKMGNQAPAAHALRSARSTLSFQTLMTGVWDYDHLGKLVFDQNFKDRRQGYVTFGKIALVVCTTALKLLLRQPLILVINADVPPSRYLRDVQLAL